MLRPWPRAIMGPQAKPLRAISNKHRYQTFDVPDKVVFGSSFFVHEPLRLSAPEPVNAHKFEAQDNFEMENLLILLLTFRNSFSI